MGKDNGTIILKILREQVNIYESLLNNFIFYLPIQTIRDRGCMQSKEAKLGAIWLIGIKKDLEPEIKLEFVDEEEIKLEFEDEDIKLEFIE